MAERRLLIVYAYPDDETFGLGGFITKLVAEGTDVYLICATNGDAGSMDATFLDGGKTIKQVRLEELDCAAKKLKLKKVFALDYRDSGMMGTPDNEHPDSLWYAWNTDADSVTRRVASIMRRVRPHVVITFNEYGGYGHPDHIAIQRATVEAMKVVNDASYVTEDNCPPYQPQKLYYSNIQKTYVRIGIWRAILQGKNPRKLGRNKDVDIVAILENCIQPTTRVRVKEYVAAWDEANACHASQGGGRTSFLGLPRWLRSALFPDQYFTRMYPEVSQHGIIESDMFEGITLNDGEMVSV